MRYGCGSRTAIFMALAAGMAAAPSLPVSERAPRAMELQAYPPDGAAAPVNPPGFQWTPYDQATGYRVELRAGSRIVLSSEVGPSTVYVPDHALEPGSYVWQVTYVNRDHQPFGVSIPRRFEVRPGTPELPMPDIAALEKRLAGVRPRLFLSGDRLARLQAAVAKGAVPSWARLRDAADGALLEPSYPEPAAHEKGEASDTEWLRVFTPGKIASAHLARTAIAYRITGDRRYLEGARRWMLALSAWDPRGITSHGLKLADGTIGNDEASMPMLERMSLAWDWMGAELTPEERARVLAAMKERGNQVLGKLEADDFLSHPYNNHSGRVLAFLGEAGLAFLGDLPDAARWLDYVLRAYLTSYPSWGGDEGGWSQGLSYWAFYVYNQTNFAEALRQAAGIDLFRRPFYRNTGYLPVYFHPPYAPLGAFGDGGYHPPNELEGLLTDFLATTFRDPVVKWQARQVLRSGEKNQTRWREWFMEDVISTWRAIDENGVPEKRPDQLDGSRYLPDIGWVAMHSALGDAENDVWALFKSSRFGSYSHSHADQNTFQLNAYGHALAIDSGYYPSYGTPHDNLWTRQTVAHNGILVNGRGQPPHTWEAGGRIESYERSGVFTLVRGEAGGAYNLPQPADLAALWTKLLRQPVPPAEPRVERFERTAAFVASRTRPVLVVSDLLTTDGPAVFDWMLHALNAMETDDRRGAILVRDGNVRLAVRLIASAPLRFSQQGKFPIEPEPVTNTAYVLGKPEFPDQWHLRATTGRAQRTARFLAVMVPYRVGEPEPAIEVVQSGDTAGFRVGDLDVAAWWGVGPAGRISANGMTGEGRLMLRLGRDQSFTSR
jgi:hypothetical protein